MGIESSVQRVEALAVNLEPPLVLDAATPTREVIARMRECCSGYALLASDDKLVGIFTERDVLTKVLGDHHGLDSPVAELMTREPVCVGEADSVRKAVHAMRQGGFRNVPVIDSQCRVVGCIRHKDIVRYLVEHFAQQVLNLPPDPYQVAVTPEGG